MKKILLFNTSYGTQNLGDFIINEAIRDEMSDILKGNFIVNYGTHNPILRITQHLKPNPISDYCKKADLKFLCGTNLFAKSLDCLTPNFNINLYDAKCYKDSISIGCGMGDNSNKITLRTKKIYKKILSNDIIHSVRDEKTKKTLEELGKKVINTGCPTLWKLTEDFCRQIPKEKANNVIFTLTDYMQNSEIDQKLIDILVENYKNVYFWVQGSEDYDYYMQFKNTSSIKVIPPSLDEYKKVLGDEDIEYVGTRLHAGIQAMRLKKRSIIIIVDNRARDMKNTYGLVTIERARINQELNKKINSTFETKIKINETAIKKWKKQFEA